MAITLNDGSKVYSVKDSSSPAPEQLRALGVSQDELDDIDWSNNENWDDVVSALAYILPMIGIIGVIAWLGSRVVKYDPKG